MNDLEDKFLSLANNFQKDEKKWKDIINRLIKILIKDKWFIGFIPILVVSLLLSEILPIISIIGMLIFSGAALIETAGLALLGYSFMGYHNIVKLNGYINIVKKNLDDYFYISYVLTDYFKDANYKLKDLRQMNKYLSKFEKDEHNSCFNEIGMKYNYNPISDGKDLQIKDKKKEEIDNNEFNVIVDTNLVDKYIEQSSFSNQSSVNNLELKPGVFDKEKKKVNKNSEYCHIEVSIGKIKVLTIDKYK